MHHATKTHTVAGQQFLSVLEKTAEHHFHALLKQLNVGLRHEVQGLLRRIAQLEERLAQPDEPLDHEPSTSNAFVTRPPTQAASFRRYADVLWDEV